MRLFIGLAPVSLIICGYAIISLGGPPGTLIMLAGLVYLIGCFGVAVFFNVPMNEELARMGVSSQAASDYRTRTYLPHWTFWNTVRTMACGLSAALLLLGPLLAIQSLLPFA